MSQLPHLARVIVDKKTQSNFRRTETSRRIETRAQTETNFRCRNRRCHRRHIHQRAQSRPASVTEASETVTHNHAIFTAQRNEVAQSSHRGKIEKITQIRSSVPGDFLNAMTELENKGGRTQVGVAAHSLRVNDRPTGNASIFRLMMINDHKFDAPLRQPRRLLVRRSPTIQGHNKRRTMRGKNAVQPLPAQSIPLRIALRQKNIRLQSQSRKKPMQNGQRRDAVHIIIAV